jgi:enoyl-CoA hydratase/carnithine racemase
MAYKCLLYDVKDGIATLALNRPERLNALSDTLREDVHDAVGRAAGDEDVRVLVITGVGKGFCAGGDVKAMHEGKQAGMTRSVLEKIAPLRDQVLRALRDAPKPVSAAVNGPAAGAGMNLALACDIRLASTTARFGQTFVRRGLHPDWGGTYFLPRIVGMAKAAELIFTGEMIDAAEALRLGLVSAVHSPEELMPVTYALARKIADGPPLAIRLARRALYHNQQVDLRQALEFETFAQNVCYDSDDAREGIRAFVEKRDPVFRGR